MAIAAFLLVVLGFCFLSQEGFVAVEGVQAGKESKKGC